MDPRLLRYYNLELQHLREMGAEFAEQFPKIAARLGPGGVPSSSGFAARDAGEHARLSSSLVGVRDPRPEDS